MAFLAAAIAILVAGLLSAGSARALMAQTVTVTGAGNTVTLTWGRTRAGTSFSVARRQLVLDARGQPQSAAGYSTIATVTSQGYRDVLTVPSVLYEYQVSAVGADGTLYPGAPVQYAAPAFTTVTNLSVTGTASQANVAWTAAFGVAGYQVWRRTVQHDGTTGAPGQRTAQLLPASGFADPSLVPGELYEYQVVSVTPDGTGWPSSWVRYVPPTPPVVSLGGAGDRVILNWTRTSGAVGYQIARYALDQTGRRASGGPITGSPVAADTYTDGLPSPALYQYQVVAVLADGSTIGSEPVSYPAPAFTTPLGVGAAAVGLRGVVTWNAGPGVTGYQVWRRFVDPVGRVSAATQVAVVPPGGTVWLDTLPDATSRVEYQVIGLSKDGRSWPSAWVLGR